MTVLISGASGLVGSALAQALANRGDRVVSLTRRTPTNEGQIHWHPETGRLDPAPIEGLDAVVHLAGENIASGRWTTERKARIRNSRIDGTRLLCETLAQLNHKPDVLISASAIGYYGHRGDEILTEDSPHGTGFLPEVSLAWERAAQPARDAGIRTASARIGVVLTAKGGALSRMLLPFKLGVGGVIGPGTQYMSWISLDDLIAAILFILDAPDLSGPINAVGPMPVTNRAFTRALGRALSRPTLFPLPAFAARLALGEMADALLLASTRVHPARLQASGFTFRHSELSEALDDLLSR